MQVGIHGKGGPDLPIVLCSHDCELENPRSRLGIIVAPLLPWPHNDMTSDPSLELISSSQMHESAYSFINLFPLKLPIESLNGDSESPGSDEADSDTPNPWRIVDFSTMTSAAPPNKAGPIFLKGKRLEMTDDVRLSFKRKLAAFFGR